MNYDIFLEESGLLLESSSDSQEREEYANDNGRKFSSQIAGIVCREGITTSGNVNSILKTAFGICAISEPIRRANSRAVKPTAIGLPRRSWVAS